MSELEIRLKRAREKPAPDDGYRVLVDRLWPRGMSREALELDEWCKELAPGNELRRWFAHDPARWKSFQQRYRAELRDKVEQMDRLTAAVGARLTLVYDASDERHNQAVVLRRRLLERIRKKKASRHRA